MLCVVEKDFTNANLISAIFDGADIEGADFSDSLLDKVTTLKLCKVAKGIHPKTGVPTAESLMCPEWKKAKSFVIPTHLW